MRIRLPDPLDVLRETVAAAEKLAADEEAFVEAFDALPSQLKTAARWMLDRPDDVALLSMRERNRFLRGMTVWVGYTQAAVPYQRDARYAGETKYTLSKMLKFSLDAISSFSHRPLQLATLLGFLISTAAKNQMQAMQLSFFTLLPSILLSGFMFPFAGMPGWAQAIGSAIPATHFLRLEMDRG